MFDHAAAAAGRGRGAAVPRGTQVRDDEQAARAEEIARVLGLIDRLQQALQAESSTGWLQLDLTLPQVKVLMLLSTRGVLRMSALGRALGTTVSTATGIVDRLVERNLVERAADPADRRIVLVRLTGAGHETLERVSALTRDRMAELLARLDARELRTVAEAMEILLKAATFAAG